jgi:Na+-driven multidrug efflux pump
LIVTATYNMADTFFVGRLGTSATGGIGVTFPS